MRVSVITATWNSGRTVRDTMESVLAQSYPDIEHIVVDGGSKDNTMDIVHELEPRYCGRLKYVSERDRGIYDAMNKGIAMATGEIIGILNSDDFFTSDTVVESLAQELEDQTIEAVYGDIHYVDDDDLSRCVRYYSSASFRPWKMRMGFQPAHPSFYCRRRAYEKFGTFDIEFRIAADFENMLRLLYIGQIPTRYVPVDCVTMRTGGASTSGLSSHRQILADHLKAYRKNGVKSNVLLDTSRYLFKIAELLKSKL